MTGAPAAVLVAILAIKQVLVVPGLVTEPLLSLTGHIAKMPRAILLNGVVCVGLIVVLAPFGIKATALGQCAAALMSFLISTRLQGRYGGLAWNCVLSNCAYVAVAIGAMSATVYLLGYVAEALRWSVCPPSRFKSSLVEPFMSARWFYCTE